MANKSDVLTVISKGALGAIPLIGPLAAEVVGTLIPNQRVDRIESFLRKLEETISLECSENITRNFTKEEAIDVLEESMIQASKALTEDRKKYIAQLVANSLSEEEIRNIEYKRLLQILGDINDAEIIILKNESFEYFDDELEPFQEKHKHILSPKDLWEERTPEEAEADAIFSSYSQHLVSLGLLKPKFKIKKGETPDFDEKTGMIKSTGYEVTELGGMLLKSIGL